MTFIAKENKEKQSFSENEFKDFNACIKKFWKNANKLIKNK